MSENNRTAVLGMGYVGLTLSVVLASKKIKVDGVEINKEVLSNLLKGEPHFHEVGLSELLSTGLKSGYLSISDDISKENYEVYIISVGTPLIGKTNVPNIEYITSVIKDVGRHMKKGSLVILRSTVPVGTTRDVVLPNLEKYSGLVAGRDFHLAFAPERTAEGRALIELETLPQIIGGLDEASLAVSKKFFSKIQPNVIGVSSLESAEMIKIIDNSYRDVSFAFSNEIALISQKLGLDTHELISKANIGYSRNNIHYPSPGVGGACLSKDPHILVDFSKKIGYDARLISEGRKINENMTVDMVERISSSLDSLGKRIEDSRICIIGFAFKGEPETSDLRDSTTLWFIDELIKKTKNIVGFDPVIATKELDYLPIKISDNVYTAMEESDVVVLFNNHLSYKNLDISKIVRKINKPAIIYDCWGMLYKTDIRLVEGINYMGVGF